MVAELNPEPARQAGQPGIGLAGRGELDVERSELLALEIGDHRTAERLGDELVPPAGAEQRLARGDQLLHHLHQRRGERVLLGHRVRPGAADHDGVETLDVARRDVRPGDDVAESELLRREAGKVDEAVLLLALDLGLVADLEEKDLGAPPANPQRAPNMPLRTWVATSGFSRRRRVE